MVVGGWNRKTLKEIPYYPSPKEIYESIIKGEGWPYRTNREFFLKRDRALVALLYLGGLRVSEALRIRKSQFVKRRNFILIRGVELSKSRVKGKPRRIKYRDVRLPLRGERAPLRRLIMEYVELLDEDERLFPWSLEKNKHGQIMGCKRAWQIVKAILPDHTCHWLRAYCEDYLYSKWRGDLLAVSDYIKVDARTLQQYIRKRYERYPVV